MTGAYLRVNRDGKWCNVEIDAMTDNELDELEVSQSERGWLWAKFLAKYIRDEIAPQFEEVV